jgi:hypothetical protein
MMTAAMFRQLADEERVETSMANAVPAPEEWRPLLPVPAGISHKAKPHPRLGKWSRSWRYRDGDGHTLGYVARFDIADDGKEIRTLVFCEDAVGRRKWRWKGFPVPRPIFGLDRLAARPDAPVLMVEGEKTADAAGSLFLDHVVVTSPGGSKAASKTDWAPLRGRVVVVWPDADVPGNGYAEDVARLTLEAGAEFVALVAVPADFPDGWDLADPPPDGWDGERLNTLLQAAAPWDGSKPETAPNDDEAAPVDDETLFTELAALPRMEYDRRRQGEAKRLGVRVTTLDTEVDHRRPGDVENDGDAGLFADLEPWPEPVDGAALLDSLVAAFTRRVVLPDRANDALALWVMFAHAHDAAQISPILALVSPEKRCGKTTTLAVIQGLVPRALPTANITAAALFRAVEKWAPTVLIDEADTFLRDNDELRGILNSGHARGSAYVVRTVGDNHEAQHFHTWAPKAIALIGTLPDTLADRAIAVRLRRKRPDETVERVRLDRMEALTALARQAVRWVADNLEALRESDPEVPAELHDREADNWRALFAIADRAAGEWPARARATATELSKAGDDEDSARVMLLADIHAIIAERGVDRIASADLVTALVEREDRPWPEWRQGKPLTTRGLAKLLAPFGIAPGTIRNTDGATAKGYHRGHFDDALARYSPNLSVTTSQPAETLDFSPNPIRHKSENVTDGKTPKPAVTLACDVVTDENPETTEEGGIEAGNEGRWSVSL